MDERDSIKQRLFAVLDYDGIPQNKRTAYLANACGCSRSTARRLLTAERNAGKMGPRWLLGLARGLNVDWRWLYDAGFERFDPRTFRIHAQQVKHYPKEEANQMVRLLLASYAGHRKAGNLVDLVNAGQLSLHRAAQLMC